MAEEILTSVRVEEKLLLMNHLEFLRTHRGELYFSHDAWCINSDRKEYTFAIPEPDSSVSALVARYGTFYLKPACLKFENELWQMGFTQTGALNYMITSTADARWKKNELVEVKKANDEDDIRIFSEIQGRGFCDSENEFAEWHPWLREANLRNFKDGSQVFYIAYSAGEPAGVAIAIFRNPLAGIYAVATLPSHRKQGVSTTILNCIAEDAFAKGIELLTLQTVHGSYAEFFYQRLGFKSSFLVKIMSRQ